MFTGIYSCNNKSLAENDLLFANLHCHEQHNSDAVYTLKEYLHKDYLSFQKRGIGETNISNKFYENQWIDFVDMAICIFLND